MTQDRRNRRQRALLSMFAITCALGVTTVTATPAHADLVVYAVDPNPLSSTLGGLAATDVRCYESAGQASLGASVKGMQSFPGGVWVKAQWWARAYGSTGPWTPIGSPREVLATPDRYAGLAPQVMYGRGAYQIGIQVFWTTPGVAYAGSRSSFWALTEVQQYRYRSTYNYGTNIGWMPIGMTSSCTI